MAGRWIEVVSLRFKGERFRDHALDLSALSELSQFQKLIAETAKSLWRSRNPDRKNLPSHFEQRTRLCLREIRSGSAQAPLEVFIEDPEQGEFWPSDPEEVQEAVDMAYNVFHAVEHKNSLPDRFSKSLVSEYCKWGETLADDEVIEIIPPSKKPVRMKSEYRARLFAYVEVPYEDFADISGEVFEADVRQKRFQLLRDAHSPVAVSFDDKQEELVTEALKDHKSVKLRVTGRGEYSPEGQLLRFKAVNSLNITRSSEDQYDPNAQSIEDILATISAEVPPDEWDKLPRDLTNNLDHYLYGTGSE